jgi:hypothetical protein
VQIAIVIDIAFIFVVFLSVSLVRADLHIENGDRCSSFATHYRSCPRQKMLGLKSSNLNRVISALPPNAYIRQRERYVR